jgi:hypothetical protein
MWFWKNFLPIPEVPLVTPYIPENVGCSSLDIFIGDTIKKSTPNGWIDIDLSQGQKYALHYGEFVLTSGVEICNFPRWIAASIDLRSSSARLGCQHLKAGHCEPGWHDSVPTLELICVDKNQPFILEMVTTTAIAQYRKLSQMLQDKVTLDSIVEELENVSTRITSAPLVGYDETGSLRYITAWDIHTVEEGEEDFLPFITSARLVFRFGDIADV